MAYQTYITEALVCGGTAHNTSDKSFLLFTRDAGMLYASARSVREERSKQRFALQEFSYIRASLVRGKAGWRIGSVENEWNTFSVATTRAQRAAVLRVIKLLRQFMHGEESHPGVYEDTRTALTQITNPESPATPGNVAQIFALRLLYALGYIALDDTFRTLVTGNDWATYTGDFPAQANRAIEQAQRVSHL